MTSVGQGDGHLVSIRSQRRLNCEDRLTMSVQAACVGEGVLPGKMVEAMGIL